MRINRTKSMDVYHEYFSLDKNVASTERFNEIIKDIFDQFQQYRTKIMKLIPNKKNRDKFKIANGISTERYTSSINFLNLSPAKNNLRLSFPTIPNNTATQILEMRGDNVEKSFYIIDNKLLKINLRTKYDRFIHYGRKMYFYDNEYVEKSNLNTYLEIIQKKLHEVNTNLNTLEAPPKSP